MRIVDVLNTRNPCIHVLESLGFKVRVDPTDSEERVGDWFANRDDIELVAEDPVRLLGLAALVLFRGEEWRRPDDAPRHSEIIDAAYPDN